jgi:hypothetical protein
MSSSSQRSYAAEAGRTRFVFRLIARFLVRFFIATTYTTTSFIIKLIVICGISKNSVHYHYFYMIFFFGKIIAVLSSPTTAII